MATGNRNTPVLGILGGMGPAATAEFYRLFVKATPATKDQDHLSCLVLSDPHIPDRTESILNHNNKPLQLLATSVDRLVASGVQVVASPCNTAHYFLRKIPNLQQMRFVDIAEATLKKAVQRGVNRCVLYATRGTILAGIYQETAQILGVELLLPCEHIQTHVDETIRLVKAGRMDDASQRFAYVESWRVELNVSVGLLACTELPLLSRLSSNHISSLQALAEDAVEACYEELGCNEHCAPAPSC